MVRRMVWMLGLAVCLSITTATAYADVIHGPTLTEDMWGWFPHGLQITALADVTLDSFIYNNQGLADLVELRDTGGSTLYSYAVLGGNTAELVSAGWDLTAGTTYHLVASTDYNGRWADYTAYPTGNTELQVDGVWAASHGVTQALYDDWWFDFTELTTSSSSAVPELPPFALAALGLIPLGLKLRRRK